MGYIRHHAIIVTSHVDQLIEAALIQAKRCNLVTAGPVEGPLNGYQTLLIAPDGSKEGWPASDDFDDRRAAYVAWLDRQRYDDGSSSLDWLEVAYGSDDWDATITIHAWEKNRGGGEGPSRR